MLQCTTVKGLYFFEFHYSKYGWEHYIRMTSEEKLDKSDLECFQLDDFDLMLMIRLMSIFVGSTTMVRR